MTIDAKTFMKTATKEQKDLIFALADLAGEENKLASKINRIFKNARPDAIHYDGDGITVCENEDDARIITAEDRRKLNDVKRKIAALLKKARDEMSMADVGIIERQWKNYKEFATAT